jgi:aconitate hydratase 2/2-methylisocitrate dehydratase
MLGRLHRLAGASARRVVAARHNISGGGSSSSRSISDFLSSYKAIVADRAKSSIDPPPLDAKQTAALCKELQAPQAGEADELHNLLALRVPPGVDEAAYVKAAFLDAVANGEAKSPVVSPAHAVKLLGTMQGGYNVQPLVKLLSSKNHELAEGARVALSDTLLVFDAFHDVVELHNKGNKYASALLQSWANADWFTSRAPVPEKITVTVFKVPGETNTDDLSPAQDAWSRPDIPLHARAMLKMARDGIVPDVPGEVGPMNKVQELRSQGHRLAYVGDVVGTGSSRKSAANSILWHMGEDLPYVPNKRGGGVCIGSKIAPIFFNTLQDSGALPLEFDVRGLSTGQVIDLHPYKGVANDHKSGEVLAKFAIKSEVIFDEVRAGGRIPLIIGRGLTHRARQTLGLPANEQFRSVVKKRASQPKGYTLAQKMVGKACGVPGVLPGEYCEPLMTTVGSQDTTGPMTRDELKDLACLGFNADLVMQSFCHTAAYPKPVDVITHKTLPDFIRNRGGVSLKPGDGVIHTWLNRMLIPDTVGTGGDSHTRFPIGISFPAGSGLVAFAAATGTMPLDMPESVLVRFRGKLQPGVTLRDLVHAIPYYALKSGDLTVEKVGKKNVFSGRVLEIEGLPHLKCEQAFELSDASAERSAAGCTIKLDREPIEEYLRSNVVMLKWMISEGYGDSRTLERRIARMEEWLANPVLMEADKEATYHKVFDIDISEITEPILCCPNDPDDAKMLSQVAGDKIDEVFIGSCMTNIGHFRAAGELLKNYKGSLPTRLWVAPPTKMDAAQLSSEGYYYHFGRVGARTEMPGCSLCMGNQARVAEKSTVVSTSTRNFPNRLGAGANVYLASAELAAVSAIMGKLPTKDEYMEYAAALDAQATNVYRYLNFNQLPDFTSKADTVALSDEMREAAHKLQQAMSQ